MVSGFQFPVSGFWFLEKTFFIQWGGPPCPPKLAGGSNLYFHGSRVSYITHGNNKENKKIYFVAPVSRPAN
jgi:hypothetical protein